jgi:hypothetical protein
LLLRGVLSDTHQPSFVEAADQQEHCSLSLKSGRAEVCGNFDIKSRAAVRWNKFRQIFISYHLAIGEYLFSFRSDERLPAVSIHYRRVIHIPAYEMKQISADFHLISRLSGSHINRHSYKSH